MIFHQIGFNVLYSFWSTLQSHVISLTWGEYMNGSLLLLYDPWNNNGIFPLTQLLSASVDPECNKSTHFVITELPRN